MIKVHELRGVCRPQSLKVLTLKLRSTEKVPVVRTSNTQGSHLNLWCVTLVCVALISSNPCKVKDPGLQWKSQPA